MNEVKDKNEKAKKNDVPQELLDYSKHIFDRHAADFDHLDNKAIGVMGIVGLLVSFQTLRFESMLSLFNDVSKTGSPCVLYTTLIILLVYGIFLAISIWFALCAFQVRELEYPTEVMELVERYRKIDKDEKVISHLRVNIIKTYASSISSLQETNARKAKYLKISVISVFIAIVSLGLFLIFQLIYKSV